MLKAVIWDNDGVLVDTEELYFNTTRKALSKVGIDLTRDLFVQISLGQGRSTFDLEAAQGVEQDVIDRLRTERNLSYCNLLRSGVRVLEGVEDTLCRLRGKVLMGVVTNSRREHFEIIHIATGLLYYFDFVLTREDYKKNRNPIRVLFLQPSSETSSSGNTVSSWRTWSAVWLRQRPPRSDAS